MSEKITHGRHCICTPCRNQDWTLPHLAPCGMHGPSCPREYQPWGKHGSFYPPEETTSPPGVSIRERVEELERKVAELEAALQSVRGQAARGDRALSLLTPIGGTPLLARDSEGGKT